MKNYIVLDLEWNQSPDGKEGTIDHFPFYYRENAADYIQQMRRRQMFSQSDQLIEAYVNSAVLTIR